MTEPVTTPGGQDPDGCTGVIIALLLEAVIGIVVLAWWLFR